MGISVEGQKCPICGAYIFDDDDLVFCPECGAPHHRDCYEALGHCAYEDKHGTAEGYNPEAEKEKAEKEQAQNNADLFGDEPHFEEKTIPCRFCGEPLSPAERVCHNCGRDQMVGGPGATPFGPGMAFDPLGGISPNEKIGEVTAKEIKDFVVINTPRYLQKFKDIKSKKKKSWNWAAFLLPETWFFYRKMYFPGILFATLMLVSSVLLFPFQDYILTLDEATRSSMGALSGYFAENAAVIAKESFFYLGIGGVVLNLITRVIAGFMGDRIYLKTVTEGIKSVKSGEVELEIPIETALARKGSVNALLGLILLFSFDTLVALIRVII